MMIGHDSVAFFKVLDLYRIDKSRRQITRDLNRRTDDRIIHKVANALTECNLIDESTNHQLDTWGTVNRRNENGDLFFEFYQNIYDSMPEAVPKTSDVLISELGRNADFFLPSKKIPAYDNRLPERSMLITYPYNNGPIAKALTRPLEQYDFATTRGALSSKNVLEEINNHNIITHMPIPTLAGLDDKNISEIIKKTVENNSSLNMDKMQKKIAAWGTYASITPSYIIHNPGVSLEEIGELYYIDGAIVDIILAQSFKKRYKKVHLIPTNLLTIFKEASKIFSKPDLKIKKYKNGLIVKDTVLALMKLEFPKIISHHYTEFTNARIDEALILTQDFIKSDGSSKVLRLLDKSRFEVAKTLGTVKGKTQLVLEQMEHTPTLFKSNSKYVPKLRKLDELIKKLGKLKD